MHISIIAAFTDNRVLGKDNQLIWHLPEDLKNFKRLTSGYPIIMGRKTFESLGRPLPNRTNIIVTRNDNYLASGCVITTSLEQALEKARATQAEKVFIIGGGEIYRQALPIANDMYLTHVHAVVDGDTYFPEFSTTEWKQVENQHFDKNEKNIYDFDIITWKRIS